MTGLDAAGGGNRSGAVVNASVGAGISTGISKRKLRANRLGKPTGTGPTSAAGKARSAQNARKHGATIGWHGRRQQDGVRTFGRGKDIGLTRPSHRNGAMRYAYCALRLRMNDAPTRETR